MIEQTGTPPSNEPITSTRLVLASASPRRRALLDLLGLEPEIDPADVDEDPLPGENPADHSLRLALEKARAVAARHPHRPVLGSDTVVEIDGESLGKPIDAADARSMLRRLSGREHLVHTGTALVLGSLDRTVLDTTIVRFRALDERLIAWYVAGGEPADKAGAYAVQGQGGLLVESITGSPHTVVGLPIHRLPELFAALGIDILDLIHR